MLPLSVFVGLASALSKSHNCVDKASFTSELAYPASHPTELNATVHGVFDPHHRVPLGPESFWSFAGLFIISTDGIPQRKKRLASSFQHEHGGRSLRIKEDTLMLTWDRPQAITPELYCPHGQECCLSATYANGRWREAEAKRTNPSVRFTSTESHYTHCFSGPGTRHLQFNAIEESFLVFYTEDLAYSKCLPDQISRFRSDHPLSTANLPVGLISAVWSRPVAPSWDTRE